jgi:hypothetical protein
MLRAVSEILSDIFFPLFIATEGVLRKMRSTARRMRALPYFEFNAKLMFTS